MNITKIRLQKMRMLADEIGRPALAKKMDISYAQLSNCIGRNPIRNIGSKMARLAEHAGGKPDGWLDTLDHPAGYDQPEDVINIPIANQPSNIAVNTQWIHSVLPTITDLKNLLLIQAYGDSMEGTFSDGDALLIDQGVRKIDSDAIYAFKIAKKEQIYTKRLQRRLDDSVLVISDNKQKYEPYPAQQNQLQILGRVVLAWKKL